MARPSSLDDFVLSYLISLCRHFKKGYCYPSQKKILAFLKKDFRYICSRRTLNYHLKRLEDSGYFRRIRRHVKDKNGILIFRSTCYVVKQKAYNLVKYLYIRFKRALGHYKKYKKRTPSDFLADRVNDVRNLPDHIRRQRFKALYNAID